MPFFILISKNREFIKNYEKNVAQVHEKQLTRNAKLDNKIIKKKKSHAHFIITTVFFMSKTKSYAQIIIRSQLFLIVMAIHLSLRVALLHLNKVQILVFQM